MAEVRMRDWNRSNIRTFGPVSDEISKSVSILYRGWNLDGPGHVVVGVAQLVGQLLDFTGVSTC